MSDEEMKAELERLRNENAFLKKGAATGITMKVSEKGGLSVYGMGRFPITLYPRWPLQIPPSVARSNSPRGNDRNGWIVTRIG